MGVHAAPESAAAALAAVVSWPVSSSKKTSKLTNRSTVKYPFTPQSPPPPRHMSVFIQLQSINSEVKDIFQWRRETTHEPTL